MLKKLLHVTGCFTLWLVAHPAFSQTDHWETAIYEGDNWRYLVPVSEPDTNWCKTTFNDASWLQGIGGIGYGDGDDNTVINTTNSLFMRRSFTISDTSLINSAILNIDYDDGFVAYLNNVEIARANMASAGHPPYADLASADHEAVMYNGGNPDYYMINPQVLHTIIKNGTNVLSIQVHNVTANSSDLSSRVWLQLGIRDNSVLFGSLPAWFSAPLEFYDSNLPIVSINTNNQAISDDPKIMADMGIIYNGQGNRNYLSDPFNNYNGKIGIELRGSSSQWIYPKKSYGFETWDVNGLAIDSALLGMPKESDWVFIAAYSDKTQFRNEFTYNAWERMGHYAPRGQPVELVINGVYQGIYFLGEKIKRDNDRVNVSKLQPTDIAGDQLTGGYILKVDKLTGSSTNYWPSLYPAPNNASTPVNIVVHYPNEASIVPQQLTYIHAYTDSFEVALHGVDFQDSVLGWRHFADENSFIDYFLLTELSKNLDAYRSSCYFYKDKNSNGGKLKMGPVWDYDLAYGNADFCDTWLPTGWAYDFNYVCSGDSWLVPFWWEKLVQDTAFAQHARCRWEYLRETILSNDSIDYYIDSMANYLDESQQRNYQTWPIIGTYVWPNYYIPATYQGEADTLKWWIHQRLNFLDTNLPGDPTSCSHLALSENAFDGVELYPNPFRDELNLRIASHKKSVRIEIISIDGIKRYDAFHESGNAVLTLPGIEAGWYLIRIDGKESKPFVRY